MSARAKREAAGEGKRADASPEPCVVIGYDGSATSRAAVDWATSMLPAGVPLVLLYAARPLHTPESPLASVDDRVRTARAYFDELLLECDDAFLEHPFETEISDHDPASALIECATRNGASAIVVGLDRHARLRSAFGTVTSELLRRSPVAVVAVPAD